MSSDLSLEYVDTEALWEELAKRSDAALFVGFTDRTEDMARVTMLYRGDPFRCEGLAREFIRKLTCEE